MKNYLDYFTYYKLLHNIPLNIKKQIGGEDNFLSMKQIKELGVIDYINKDSRYVDKSKLQEWLHSKLGEYNFYLVYSKKNPIDFGIYGGNIEDICSEIDVLFIYEAVYEGLKCKVHKITNNNWDMLYIIGLTDNQLEYLQTNATTKTAYKLIKSKFENI